MSIRRLSPLLVLALTLLCITAVDLHAAQRNGVQYEIAKAILQEQDIAAQEGGTIEPLQPAPHAIAPAPTAPAKPTAAQLAQQPMDESEYISAIAPKQNTPKTSQPVAPAPKPKRTQIAAVAPSSERSEKASDDKNGHVICGMKFSLESWSAFYKSGKGHGTITCDNGQRAQVAIRTHGGGITFGKSKVSGHAEFSKVRDLEQLFGSYASTSAHAGAKKSSDAQAMFKGKIGMKLAAKGEGWDLGFTFGSFNISPVK